MDSSLFVLLSDVDSPPWIRLTAVSSFQPCLRWEVYYMGEAQSKCDVSIIKRF